MLRPHGDAGKDARQRLEDVVALLGLAAHVARLVDADVGGAEQHPAEIGEEDADPPVGILEEDHVAVEGVEQRGMVEDQMRSLGAADERLGRSAAVGQRGQLVSSSHAPVALTISPRRDRRTARRSCLSASDEPRRLRASMSAWLSASAAGREPLRVEDELDAQPLGVADPGVVIGGGEAQLRRQGRPERQRLARAAERDAAAAGGGGG